MCNILKTNNSQFNNSHAIRLYCKYFITVFRDQWLGPGHYGLGVLLILVFSIDPTKQLINNLSVLLERG